MKFIVHYLVHVFPVRLKDVLFKHQSMDDSKDAVHPVYKQDNDVCYVLCLDNQFTQNKDNYKGYAD